MSTPADLEPRSRLAHRLPVRIPGVRHRPVHDWLRADPGADTAEDGPAASTVSTAGGEARVDGAVSRTALRADVLATASREITATLPMLRRFPVLALAAVRRTITATLPVLRRFLVLALVALFLMAPLATIGVIQLRAALDAVTVALDPHVAVEATRAAAAARSAASGVEATWAATAVGSEVLTADPEVLHVHVQKQAFLHAGGERQFRLAVDGGSPGLDRSDGTDAYQLLLVDLAVHKERSGGGSVSVTPTQLVVTRSELKWTPIWIEVAADVPCWSSLGELHVQVRDLAPGGLRAETIVALPPVDCRAAPPAVGEHR